MKKVISKLIEAADYLDRAERPDLAEAVDDVIMNQSSSSSAPKNDEEAASGDSFEITIPEHEYELIQDVYKSLKESLGE